MKTKTLSQILNLVPADITYVKEGTSYGILKNSLSDLGFKQAPLRDFKDLPKEDIYTLYGIPMRAGKWADVWFASLEDMYAIIDGGKIYHFDHMGNALKRLGQLGVQRESALEEGTQITAAQVEKYIDNQDFEALADLSKHMSKDEYKTWSANGFEGRTYELLMKIRRKNENCDLNDESLNEEVDYYKFKQLVILGLLSAADANKAALGMKAIEGGHPPTQEQKAIIGDTLVLLVNMITGDSAVLNKLKKTARDAKNATA